MNSQISSLCLFTGFSQHVRPCQAAQRARFAATLGLFGMLVMILAGCTIQPAAAQSTQPGSTPGPRQMVIEDQEDVYIAVANANEQLRLDDWLAAGWTLGNALGAEDAVPHDCALHTRKGVSLQVFARCPGPRQIAVPHATADFVYVMYILGKVDQAELDRTMTPQSTNDRTP